MEGTAPLFTLIVALGVLGSFAPLVWSSLRDRVVAMHLNEEMNEETLVAEAVDRADWEAEADAWMRGLARKARRHVPCWRRPRRRRYGNVKPRARGVCGKQARRPKPSIKSVLTGGTREPIMRQKTLPQDKLDRRMAAARRAARA